MAEPGVEGAFRSKAILCTEVTCLEMSLPLDLCCELHASLNNFFPLFFKQDWRIFITLVVLQEL